MHDLLRPLVVKQKKRRSEHHSELVAVYNATSHSSRGFSPYYLIFGREPVLLIDFMIGCTVDNGICDVDDNICQANNDYVNFDDFFII